MTDSDGWQLRQMSAVDAVAAVRPGDRVFVGSACATPRGLVEALEQRADRCAGVTLVHFLTDRVGLSDPPRTHFRHRVFYVGRDVRDLLPSGQVDYVPVSLADVPEMFRQRLLPLDVALVQVAPPDRNGMCSLGVSVDITLAAVQAAETVIAEVNPHQPRVRGGGQIPAERIAAFVPVDTPVVEYLQPPDEAHSPVVTAGTAPRRPGRHDRLGSLLSNRPRWRLSISAEGGDMSCVGKPATDFGNTPTGDTDGSELSYTDPEAGSCPSCPNRAAVGGG